MSICAHRPETPGFFTPCRDCACGEAVRKELKVAEKAPVVGVRANDNGGRVGNAS